MILLFMKLIIQKTQYLRQQTQNYMLQLLLHEKKMTRLLEQLKLGFKRTIKWNKYRSQMTIQPQNNNLNYLIDPTFTNVNRLFDRHYLIDTLFQIIMYQKLKLMTLMS